MTRTSSFIGAAALAAFATAATAQTAPAPMTAEATQEGLRHQIYLMEGMLARAVTSGAARLNSQFRALMPDMIVVAGDSNARGFMLDGYGVFFDVEVPVLRQSVMWSLRTMLDQDQQGASAALESLRQVVSTTSGPDRVVADQALRRLELQIRPFGMPLNNAATANGRGVQAASDTTAAAAPPRIKAELLQDPNKAYTDAVVQALIEAMVDNALPMVSFLAPEAYLTVAARDNERRDLLAPPNPYEQVSTFTLRIKAADLAAYRAGQIDRDAVRKRVKVQEF